MTRIAAAFAFSLVATLFAPSHLSAQDSSACPPTTSVSVSHIGPKTYTLKITARNNCSCRIFFQACSTAGKRACKGGLIPASQSRDFSVVTTASDTKANFNWRCR